MGSSAPKKSSPPGRRKRRRRPRGPKEPRTIGRSSRCDIVLKRGKVSRRHSKLIPHADGYLLRDLDSHNGTWFEGERVDRVVIAPGDRFTVGNVVLEIHEDGSITEVIAYTGALRHLTEEREERRREAEQKLQPPEPEAPNEAEEVEDVPLLETSQLEIVLDDEESEKPAASATPQSVAADVLACATAETLVYMPSIEEIDARGERDAASKGVSHADLPPTTSTEPPTVMAAHHQRRSDSDATLNPAFDRPNDRWKFAAVFLLFGSLLGYGVATLAKGGPSSGPDDRRTDPGNASRAQAARVIEFYRPAGGPVTNLDPVVVPAASGDYEEATEDRRIGPWDPARIPLRPAPVPSAAERVGRDDSRPRTPVRSASTVEPTSTDDASGSDEVVTSGTIPRPREPITLAAAPMYGPLATEEEIADYCAALIQTALPLLEQYHVEAYSTVPLRAVLRDYAWIGSPSAFDALLELRELNSKIDQRLVKRIRRLVSSNTVTLGGSRVPKAVEKELSYRLHELLQGQLATVRKNTEEIEKTLLGLRRGDTIAHGLEQVLRGKDRDLKLDWIAHVTQLREPSAIPVLIDRLVSTNYTVKRAIRKSLETITGLELGSRRKDWQAWWEAQKEDERDS
ncbi:MAG: FHA domain-containing protein [Planctomycetota bacterium]